MTTTTFQSRKHEAKARSTANELLHGMGNYHRQIPNERIDAILMAVGFSTLEEGIYCGREGRMSEKVGPDSWFAMTWYKMPETGNYEVVAYIS